MNGPQMSRDALLTGLRDIRLPSEAAGGVLAEALAVFGLACAAALCVLGMIRAFRLARPRPKAATLDNALTEALDLPDPQKRVALLKLLRQHAPDRFAALSNGLYRRGGVTLPELEADLRDHV